MSNNEWKWLWVAESQHPSSAWLSDFISSSRSLLTQVSCTSLLADIFCRFEVWGSFGNRRAAKHYATRLSDSLVLNITKAILRLWPVTPLEVYTLYHKSRKTLSTDCLSNLQHHCLYWLLTRHETITLSPPVFSSLLPQSNSAFKIIVTYLLSRICRIVQRKESLWFLKSCKVWFMQQSAAMRAMAFSLWISEARFESHRNLQMMLHAWYNRFLLNASYSSYKYLVIVHRPPP